MPRSIILNVNSRPHTDNQVTAFGVMDGKLCTSLPLFRISRQVISVSLVTLSSTWFCMRFGIDTDLKQASSPRYGQLTLFSSMSLYKSWYHDRANGGYVGIWCIPYATHVSCLHRSHYKVLGISALFYIFFEVHPILMYNATCYSNFLYFYGGTELVVCSVSCTMSTTAT